MSLAIMLETSSMEKIFGEVFQETREGNLVSWKKVLQKLRELNGGAEPPREWGKLFNSLTAKVSPEGEKAPWGFYFINSEGAPQSPKSQDIKPQSPKPGLTKKPTGVVWAPEVLRQDSARESWYSDDPSLRRLALGSTRCFANWSDSDRACGSCPLARWCQEATFAKMDEVARELDAIPLPEVPSPLPDAPSPLPDAPSPLPNSALPAPSPLPDVLGVLQSRGISARRVSNPFRSVCSGCGSECVANEDVIHISSGAHRGVFHDSCALGVT